MLGNSLSEAGVTKLVSQMSAASVVYLGNEVSISMSSAMRSPVGAHQFSRPEVPRLC